MGQSSECMGSQRYHRCHKLFDVQAQEGSAASASRAADAKVRRSQRFGSNLGVSAETMSHQHVASFSGTQDDIAAMDDDGVH